MDRFHSMIVLAPESITIAAGGCTMVQFGMVVSGRSLNFLQSAMQDWFFEVVRSAHVLVILFSRF